MNKRPLTNLEGALCGGLAVSLFLLQAHWSGYWHWWAIVFASSLSVSAFAVGLRLVIGEQRLERWRVE